MAQACVVIMGGGGVGKSALTAQFIRNTFASTYDPTLQDSYTKTVVVDDQSCTVEVVDTAGSEQFLALKDLYIRRGQGFLLVFSLTSLASVNELGPLWDTVRRLKDDGSDQSIPIVLIGNKSDLRAERQVPREVGTNLSRAWGNIPYYETSARKRVNVDQIFTDLIRQVRVADIAGIPNHVKQRAATTTHTSPNALSSINSADGAYDSRRRCLIM